MDEETRVTQVSEQVNRLQVELSKLKDEIDGLRNRLAPVLRERQPANKAEDEDEKPIPLLVPLANTLRDCTRETVILALQIAEITHLLEV